MADIEEHLEQLKLERERVALAWATSIIAKCGVPASVDSVTLTIRYDDGAVFETYIQRTK